ncbi:hypothetical protein GCM10010176_096360 [Nonomuraea spiralis]|nr:hypothetical protein GCM10010176_096360 [Nonomuraea spiralis]
MEDQGGGAAPYPRLSVRACGLGSVAAGAGLVFVCGWGRSTARWLIVGYMVRVPLGRDGGSSPKTVVAACYFLGS